MVSLTCTQRYITTNLPDGNIQGFFYNLKLNATYQMSNTLIIELFVNHASPRFNTQTKIPPFNIYNFALRKQIFQKKASIAFTATNPFNKYVYQKSEITGQNFTSYNILELPYRSFGINFTYNFGKLEFKKQKVEEDINLTNPPIPIN